MARVLVPGLIAAFLAAAAPAPALAQTAAQGVSQREARLGERIDEAEKQHALGKSEAEALRHELRRIQRLDRYYRRSNGLSAWERRDLERRLKGLGDRLAAARRAHPPSKAQDEPDPSENASASSS